MGTNATTRSRRAVLTAALATAAASRAQGACRPAYPSPDAELLEACARFTALEQQFQGLFDGPCAIEDDDERDLAGDPILEAQAPALAIILSTPARTLAGLQAKARVAALQDPEALKPKPYVNAQLARSLLSDVLELRAPG